MPELIARCPTGSQLVIQRKRRRSCSSWRSAIGTKVKWNVTSASCASAHVNRRCGVQFNATLRSSGIRSWRQSGRFNQKLLTQIIHLSLTRAGADEEEKPHHKKSNASAKSWRAIGFDSKRVAPEARKNPVRTGRYQ